ncbi:ubiquitin-like-conjugating enzyme ATG10 isoform X5 [Sceloporus undulatus]|uniref:ubiquitin-like-conjugating enzyme ATG10 isoform X5 n=1 Tax=Sceloporus undulatus TaxID=8520 RepID=UPI001C4BD616|nr:ubiquitin-like-conjugating enzyme ATG10 isoform X5 [Sceloporus undulatus]
MSLTLGSEDFFLEENKFKQDCAEFIKISQQMGDNWQWRNVKEGLDDFQVADMSATSEVIRYEYHVLYSCSYQAPVLYFQACFLDGKPLTLDEIWKNVHECYKEHLWQGPWDTVTQQEHPLLGQPFFFLHPCRTNEFMASVLSGSHKQRRSTNYIIAWLSTVGPVVGLNLPLGYAKAIAEQSTSAD